MKSLHRAFDYFRKREGKRVTPQELNDFLSVGPYASKHVTMLRLLGCDIVVTKEGKFVRDYTYITGPDEYPTKARKRRSDAGVIKKKKEPPTPRTFGEVSAYSIDADWDDGEIDLRYINT